MLKIIAMVLMVLDHLAIFIYPESSFYLRGIGQLGFPLFAFFIVQGHKYTSDKLQYIINLTLLAAITQPIWQVAYPDLYRLNDVFTLLCGLIVIVLYEKTRSWYVFSLVVLLILVNVVSFYIILVFLIYFLKDWKDLLFLSSCVFYYCSFLLSQELYILFGPLWMLFILRPLPRLNLNKYIFYAFYPVHYIIFIILRGSVC